MAFGKVNKAEDVKRSIGGAEATPSEDWDGPIWESAMISGGFTGNKLQDRINELGAKGWEPYAVIDIGMAQAGVFLRRQTR